MSGGLIINNVCKDGGGIYNEESGTVNLTDNAWITANKTSDEGGGVTNKGTMTVRDNVQITINYANTNGGGICNSGTLTVSGGKITNNNATRAGSGIYNTQTLNIQGAPFVKDNFGDDIALNADKVITLTGALTSGARIGVTSPVEKVVVTKDYGKYNSNPPTDYFFENGKGVGNVISDGGEVKLNTKGLPYVDREWNKHTAAVVKTIKHLTNYTALTSSLTELSGGKWYVVQGNITIGRRVNNKGSANLLLCDGASIEFSDGIRNEVSMQSDLNIYGQQAGTGSLCAANSGRNSAIGADENHKTGSITVLGGTLDLQKNKGLYTIGAAPHSAAGVYIFYGADVRYGGIVDIISSSVKSGGKHYGSGIGGGDANNSATVRISGNSTVEAFGGGAGNSTALGTGDYYFSKPTVNIELADELAVSAGNNEKNITVFYQNARYDAARSNSYVKVYPCEHFSFEWKCLNQDFHHKVCKNCGVCFESSHRHNFDSENKCTECKASRTPCTLTLVEKNSKGESVTTTQQGLKYASFELPACQNVPENSEFIGWRDSNDAYYIPGESLDIYSDITFTAVYLPLVEYRSSAATASRVPPRCVR